MNSWCRWALHALPDHRAVEHVHGGEQRRCVVADVVVCHRADPPLLHRQAGLRAVESLDVRLLVDREDDSMGRRVDVKADHIADLAGELRVAAELEGSQPVRRQAVGAPDLLHRADGQAGDLAMARLVQCESPAGRRSRARLRRG